MATSRHTQKVLAHAEDRLAPSRTTKPTEALPLYKKFLKIEEHRLRLRHQAGGGGREICARRAELVDVLLRRVFAAAHAAVFGERDVQKSTLTLIALGGYGRGELNPFSDVDVLLLHDRTGGKLPARTTEVVEQILYLLWDVGFKVGHSTRSIREAITHANRDMLAKTAMLEARYLAGNPELARDFRQQFRTKCVAGHERAYIEMRMQDQIARHKKFGDSVYLQEPHIKSGCGGLRDYQNLLWITNFKDGALTTRHLVAKDWLSEPDRRRIERAYDFLLRVRTDLHYATGRSSDIVHLNLQEQLATRLGYSPRNGQLRSETLMHDYYEHTRNIFRVTERITAQFASGRATERTYSLFSFLPLARPDKRRIGAFFIRNAQLYTDASDLFQREPAQIMRAFEIAQQENVDLSPELADLISRRLSLVTRAYQYAKVPREIFLRILSRKGQVGRVLRMMHRVDFLGRYIPEFGQLTCLVQHEFFHRYTADEHTLVCIDKLDALTQTTERKLVFYRGLFERLDDPAVLYLGLLLHDTGKAVGARPHAEASAVFAQRVATRLQLSPDQRKSLILLVDHHLTLSNIAQQRNLDDPATITELANVVKDQKNFDALMLLTLADGQGTSADAWSDWKESLVWQLFDATSQYLADQRLYHEQTKIERDLLREQVAKRLPSADLELLEAHFDLMPDDYFRAFTPEELTSHVVLLRTFLENVSGRADQPLAASMRWEAFPEQGHTVLIVCTWERDHLLAKIAGSLSTIPLNILSADTFPRGDHIVLSVFRVCDTKGRAVSDARKFSEVEATLGRALEQQQFEFAPLIARTIKQIAARRPQEVDFPTRIAIDNKAHPIYTLVQIQSPDRLGLLYDLLTCLDQQGIAIALSRISTQNGAAIDTFYVRDNLTRGKITDANRITALQQRLHDAALRAHSI